MDSDEEDYVFFGKPIEREEEITNRRKKAAAEASGNLRSLPPWKQEVRDEEGRRRFHGAFTGGFSAGYFNTVGTKEGWAPQSFTSSRKNRAEVKQQSIFNFLDEDEKTELESQNLGTSSQFDTFGFTAAEYARKQANKEQKQRPSAIPGPVPDELILPASESIGVKLLLKMGWRRGRAIKDLHASSLYDARREARKAFLAFASEDTKASHPTDFEPVEGEPENFLAQPADDDAQSSQSLPVFVINPKQDLHGLGYDPFKHAPEFREKKRSRLSNDKQHGYRKAISIKDSLFGSKSGKAASGFGIGALEEFDAEDEDIYAAGYDFEETVIEEDEEPSRLSVESKKKAVRKDQGVLRGFKVATVSDYQLERFDPPIIPKDFVPHHKFPGPLETLKKLDVPSPPEVPPPDDNNLKLLIEGVATLVARCGKLFEDLSRKKNQSNPLFSFLSGGNGHDYYDRKLWEEHQKRGDQAKLSLDGKLSPSVQKMTAENRGKLLGEKPLERSSRETTSSSVASGDFVQLQFNLSDTFKKPESFNELPEVAKPFKDDPAKQERFEQFLKEKYEGGLRSMGSSAASNMSEAARAHERLDFEAAAEAIEKGKRGKESLISEQPFDFLATGMQFTSGVQEVKDTHAENLMTKKMYPRREEFQWRPLPVLCKRFDLIDPFMGKPPPAPRMRSKIDSLLFMPDYVKGAKLEEDLVTNRDVPVAQTDAQKTIEDVAGKEIEVAAENVERPVDLYKAIFSDDSDEDVEDINTKKVEDQEKKIEVATTTLNRLIAGDFLESLGKELGLEVPPDMPYSTNNVSTPTQKETPNGENAILSPLEGRTFCAPKSVSGTSLNPGQETAQDGELAKNESIPGRSVRYSSKYPDGLSENISGKVNMEKIAQEDKKGKSSSRHQRNWSSSSSSEDERSRKQSRRHRYRSSDSYSDSASDHHDRYRSRSKGRRKKSSREKSSSSRKHSKHHKHRNRDSPSRSHQVSEREHSEARKEKRIRRD
ncbi:G patch domain-containing protein TGH isoform X2 [Durio zibethinus]|uniref:G patch domain-containing protein TGH isoform X2 n=1 Tax=Durio zibethinus TaxID=66656 RepID=A0A6P5Y6C0_DURZI|nr:G patch domain-containing protein TGH isoform X2 [Durio zibethinus]